MEKVIPLFPLKLVVFPESKYPLHIFESRYKNMVEDCLLNQTGFGIVAKIGKEISNIGSLVKISTVVKKYENGEFDIIVEGTQRFSIDKIEVHDNGYFIATVFEYADTNSQADLSLIGEIKDKFEGVLKKINIELDDAFWKNFLNSRTKSFKIAEKSGLTISEQQELLALQDENKRLAYLRNHFKKLDEQLSKNISDKIIIMNDGYIN